jgi:hypothetical protein
MKYVLGYMTKDHAFHAETYATYQQAHARFVELDLVSRMIYKIITPEETNANIKNIGGI